GHALYVGASPFQVARRFAVRVLLCFFFGTAIGRVPSLSRQSRLGRSGNRSASTANRSSNSVWPGHSPRLRFPPHVAQSPWQSERQSGENGISTPTTSRTICSGSS